MFNKNNNNWLLHYVSRFNSNLQTATIYLYLVFLKSNIYIYQNKNKTNCKVTRHVESKIQTYYLSKRFNMSYYFTI